MGNYFIGIMTGTSADSLDGCLVSFEKNFKFIESITAELEGNYKSRYEAVSYTHLTLPTKSGV